MSVNNKSILDNIPVEETSGYKETFQKSNKRLLGIVGHCPSCGAPVFGKSVVFQDEIPEVKYSCECKKLAFDSLVHTK